MITVDVGPPVMAFLKLLWDAMSQEAGFLNNVGKILENLERKRDELVTRANSVIREVHRAELEGKIPTYETVEWMRQVDDVKKEVSDAEKQIMAVEKLAETCFPGCRARRRLGRRALKLMQQMGELVRTSPFAGGLTVDQLPVIGHVLPAMTLVGETTAKTTLENLWKLVTDRNVGKIGVHGMGGVGKTAIAKHINNRLAESEIFGSIIWVSVSKPFSLASLQADVARAIGLDLSQEPNEVRRSTKLFEHLNRRKKFVLILDDMWGAFSLDLIGIPQPNAENGCKILLTTRSAQVCREMETSINIKVDLLSEDEAWELFKEKIGGDAVLSPDIQPIAEMVAKKCGRLPLAIITVGRALRQVDDVRLWRHTLAELEHPNSEVRSMKQEVFGPLRFSYDHLKDKLIQDCFLCCALFPEDHKIPTDQLIEYWMGEGLIGENGDRQAEVDKGYALLNELKDAYMLEGMAGALGEECVWMHDLIRDMALHIMREPGSFLPRAGVRLKHSPKQEWLQEYERVSLMENKVEVLSSRPNCPKLAVLLLRGNPLCRIEEDSFFAGMRSLRVLDLSHTLIDCLPESITELVNLRTLFLGSCRRLKNVPSLETLQELRVLDMSHTPIENLPPGADGLVKLRRLDLSHTENLKMFPRGLLAKLPLLEDLSTYRSSWLWLSAAEEMEGGAGIEEIISSQQLSNLSLSFWDLDTFSRYMVSGHWKTLRRFNLMVGWKSAFWYSKSPYSVEIVSEGLLSQGSSLLLPCNTQRLHIENCHDVLCLSEISSLLELSALRDCSVYTCWGIECLATANGNPLSSIERLNIWDLPNLSSLCQQKVQTSTFAGLRILEIGSCDSMRSVFPLPLLRHLQKLEQLRVVSSASAEKIIAGEEKAEAVALPSLKKLDLKYLAELTSIYSGELVCDSLIAITVEKCPKLKRLPISVDQVPPMLEVIKGDRELLDSLRQDDSRSRAFFQKYCREC